MEERYEKLALVGAMLPCLAPDAAGRFCVMKTVSVIILNWNGKRFLHDCLSSLKRQTFADFEVILVDNGSRDGSTEFIKRNFGDFVKLIENKANYGFAGGNNIGISNAKGRYIVLLNNDTRADPQFLKQLVCVAEQYPRVGMCAAKVYIDSGQKIIDTVGHLLYRDGLNRGRGRLELDTGQYDTTEEVLFPSGCAALYKKEMLDEVGLLDEDFFAYGDDTDIGLKARLGGWTCLYVPRAVVYHKYSGSTSAYSPMKAFLVERNRIWIAIKYFPLGVLLLNPYYTLIRYVLQAYGALAHKGAAGRFTEQYSHLKLLAILLKAYIAAIQGLPKMWQKRKRIQEQTKVSKRRVYSWFDRFAIGAKELALKD